MWLRPGGDVPDPGMLFFGLCEVGRAGLCRSAPGPLLEGRAVLSAMRPSSVPQLPVLLPPLQDLQQVMVSGPNLNETSIVSGGYGGTAEGIIPTSTIKGRLDRGTGLRRWGWGSGGKLGLRDKGSAAPHMTAEVGWRGSIMGRRPQLASPPSCSPLSCGSLWRGRCAA